MNRDISLRKIGLYIAFFTSVLAAFTFVIAICTTPISGPFCNGSCIDYPYREILSRYPGDYFWMYPAIILMVLFVAMIACVHQRTSADRKIFSLISLSFAIISATILLMDYYLQISVIQPSITKGETDGISILTQYNPHGVFIALEEVGYMVMSLSFLFLVPTFYKFNKTEKLIRLVFLINFMFTVISFLIFLIIFGINREYRFEVTIITINYTTLIASGILIAKIFWRKKAL